MPNMTPVPSAIYRTESKTREYESIKADKPLADNISELAQTGGASLIVFEPKNDCT